MLYLQAQLPLAASQLQQLLSGCYYRQLLNEGSSEPEVYIRYIEAGKCLLHAMMAFICSKSGQSDLNALQISQPHNTVGFKMSTKKCLIMRENYGNEIA